MLSKKSGFSLIELMVVIAVVGLLASLAIASYTSQLLKSGVAEAISLMAPYEKALTEYQSINGLFPSTATNLSGLPDLPTNPNNRNVSIIDYSVSASRLSVIIQAYLNTAKFSGSGFGTTPTLLLYGTIIGNTIQWTCLNYNNSPATRMIPTQFLPGSCQQTFQNAGFTFP